MNVSSWWKPVLAAFLAADGLTLVAGAGPIAFHLVVVPRTAATEPDARPQPEGRGKILVWRETKFVFITPEGKEAGELPGHPDKLILNHPALAPDGKRVAFIVDAKHSVDEDGNIINRHVLVRAVDGKDPGFKVAINAMTVSWTPDGKGLVVNEQTRLDLPKWAQAFGVTQDGKSVVAAVYDVDFDARKVKVHLALISRDGKKTTKLTELQGEGPEHPPKLSPDGALILFQDYDPADKPEKEMPRLPRLFVYDLRAKKRERLKDTPDNGQIFGHCWSPDGKQVAYTWKQVHPGAPLAENTDNMNDPKLNTETESHLIVADADGKNAKTLLSAKANRTTIITIGSLDWK
jgi:Tol biopolymer transport system component